MAPGQRAAACELPCVRDQALVDPVLRLQRLEGEDRAPIGAALRLPDGGVGAMRMVGDEGIGAVEITLGGVHRLRSADLFGRFAEELERTLESKLLHGRFRRQHASQRGDTEHRVRIGVAGRPGVQPFARRLVWRRLL